VSHPVNGSATIRLLEESLARVRSRIEAACLRSGRRTEEVRLVGATKGVPPEAVAAAVRAGLTDLGENYVQDLIAKRPVATGARWHFIGRLQRNKVRRVLEHADVVHALEPGPATDRLAALLAEGPPAVDCLVEVDFVGDRVGVDPAELEAFVGELVEERGVPVRGLMTVPPPETDPRPWFARLRRLADRLSRRHPDVRELSMGMSADLEAAVEEGATMVRVGTAIFGPRLGG
jgi:pyridoxal phosphate enzyme (YggS family)